MPNIARESPCYGCEERHLACHGHCARYKEWRKKVDDQIAVANEALRKAEAFREIKLRGMRRAGKKIRED